MTFTNVFRFLAVLAVSSQALAAPQAVASPSVTIASGVVVGKATTISNQPSITASANVYLGVPFAKSPPERFSPPVAASPWTSPLQAQALKPACIQQFIYPADVQARIKQYFNNPNGPPPPESEDCLYLNVYAPATATASSNLPVLFWLFGGNLQFGTGSLGYYDGTSLAVTQNVIVVTINYRTNIFGFSNSPDIASGNRNSGYLDQRFALKWVQQNIAKFGGNPNKVTIFGESAGGESVKQLLANPPSPLPFAGAILESEQSFLPGDGAANFRNVLSHFGCANTTCLRTKSATDIKAYIETNSLVFPPVQNDGTSIDDVRKSVVAGKFAKVPIFLGTNLNEFRVFLQILGVTSGQAAIQAVFNQFGITNTTLQNSIIAAYAAQGITDGYVVADRIATDLVFTCPASSLGTYLAGTGFSVWRYRYDPSFPSTSYFPNSGAYHTSEIPEVFGTYPVSNAYGRVTTQQIQLSAFMQKTWAKFAKNPAGGPGWTQIPQAFGAVFPTNYLGLLGANGGTGVTVVNNAVADYPCGVLGPTDDLLGFSY